MRIKIGLMYWLFILIPISIIAQNKQTKHDFFLSETQINLSDSQKVLLLQKKAKLYYPDQIDTMLILLDQSIKLAEKLNWKEAKADAQIEKSKAFYVKGQYYESLQVATEASVIYSQKSNYKGLAATYNTIGAIYAVLKEYPISAGYHRKSIEISIKYNDTSMIARNYFNLSISYESLNTDSALFFVNKAIELYTSLDDSTLLAMSYNRKGETHFNRSEILSALQSYQYTLSNFPTLNKWEKSFSYSGLAKSYQKLNEYDKSIFFGEKAYSLAKEIHADWDVWHVTKILSDAYAKTNNFEKAYQFLNEYSELNDSIYNAQKTDQINFLLVKQKELENKELQSQNEIQATKIRNKNLQIFIVLAGFLSLVFISTILYRNNILKKKSNEKLQKLNLEINMQREELKTAFEKLNELSQFKKLMNAMIVHDMKNLLNVVIHLGKSDMVQYAGKSMLQMVNNILDIEKFENTNIQLKKQKVSSKELILNSIKEIEYSAQLKELEIRFDSDLDISLFIDKGLIQRVIVNLLTNAIKFSPDKNFVQINNVTDNQIYKLSIKDNGEGIEASQLNKIFDKYYQANAKDYDFVRSTGLGLTFSKMAIEAHEGRISAESVMGKGATLIVELPL